MHKLLARILKAKTWETQIKSVEYPNEIYLSWIFFPHPAHSWGPPDVFWGSALTDIVMMLKRREERAACITSFLFSRENNVPNGLRICFSTTFCNHSSKGQKLLVYHVFTRFWLQFPLKTTQIDLSHSIHILSNQIVLFASHKKRIFHYVSFNGCSTIIRFGRVALAFCTPKVHQE